MFQKAKQPTMGLQPTSVRLAQSDVLVFSVREQHSHLITEIHDFGNIPAAADLPSLARLAENLPPRFAHEDVD